MNDGIAIAVSSNNPKRLPQLVLPWITWKIRLQNPANQELISVFKESNDLAPIYPKWRGVDKLQQFRNKIFPCQESRVFVACQEGR